MTRITPILFPLVMIFGMPAQVVTKDLRASELLADVAIENFSFPRDMGRFATLNVRRERIR